MAALDFPASPTNGQIYFANGRQFKWNSTENAWMAWNDFPLGEDSRVDALGFNTWLLSIYDVDIRTHASVGGSLTIGAFESYLKCYPGLGPTSLAWELFCVTGLGTHTSVMKGRPNGTLTWDPNTGTDEPIWHNANFPHSARATSTPTPTAGSGSFTSVACELNIERVGDHYDWDVTITITTNGSAAGHILVPMPFTAAKECVGAGRQCAVAGQMCQGVMPAGSSNLTIVKYDNSYPGASGERITVSGKTFI